MRILAENIQGFLNCDGNRDSADAPASSVFEPEAVQRLDNLAPERFGRS